MTQYFWIIIVSLVYLFFSITNPISSRSQDFGLSDLQIRLLQFTISIPILISWIAGAIGNRELLNYSHNLKDEDLRQSFKRIALGIIILVISSISTAFISLIRTRFAPFNPEIIPVTTIINNYLYVFPSLVGIWLIFSAIKSLSRSVRAPVLSPIIILLSMILPIVFIALNAVVTLTNASRQFAIGSAMQASYYLSDTLIILTILIPSAITWIIGTLAILHAYNYRAHVKGTVFQSAITRFTLGLLFIVIASIFLQLLLALGTERLLELGLAVILFVVYIFVILQSLGYILIALSSRKFSQVEKILSKYTGQSSYENGK